MTLEEQKAKAYDVLGAAYSCQRIHEHLTVAYWLSRVGKDVDYHFREAEDALRKAAKTLGFELTTIEHKGEQS